MRDRIEPLNVPILDVAKIVHVISNSTSRAFHETVDVAVVILIAGLGFSNNHCCIFSASG